MHNEWAKEYKNGFSLWFEYAAQGNRVINVKYMADTETYEVYSRIRLVPIKPNEVFEDCNNEENENNTSATEKPMSFVETLIQSDTNRYVLW
ncbi:hypothetical protein SUGI_0358580 [Cryptomeria japonica]|nr:hypothetical protein SUGI_0358580 [Cryptomeria japonica]